MWKITYLNEYGIKIERVVQSLAELDAAEKLAKVRQLVAVRVPR